MTNPFFMITLQQTHSHIEDTEISAVDLKNPLRLKRQMLPKFQFFKRISPCLIVEFTLPLIFVYSVIEQVTSVDKAFLFCMMVVIEINFLMIDFALWNYYGRAKSKIWMIESGLIFLMGFIIFLNFK